MKSSLKSWKDLDLCLELAFVFLFSLFKKLVFVAELAQKLDSEKEVFREEFSKMERVINDTKREHTKAIVSLQQLERQMQWQKQNNEKMVKESEEMHSHEMNKLKQIARELEKERNILLTTIKQENIKMPRLKHAGLKSCDGNYLFKL